MIRALTLFTLSAFACGEAFGQASPAAAFGPAPAGTAPGQAPPAAALAQAPPGAPAFEVASVKVNTNGERASADGKGDRLTFRNMPMRVLISLAYQVPNDRVVGPSWLDTDGFDIVAKPGPGATREALSPMMQSLLSERFKLVVHRDRTPVPVFALVVGKGGPKLQEASAESRALPRVTNTCSRQDMQLACVNRKSTMANLAGNLVRWVSGDWFDLPIVDQTGLDGVYDFTLTWTLTRRPDDPSGASDPGTVSLFDAIQDQLGLKLERRKAPVERIVIDHVERVPTGN